MTETHFYGVKILYRYEVCGEVFYEESILRVKADSFDDALAKAAKYADDTIMTDHINPDGFSVKESVCDIMDCYLIDDKIIIQEIEKTLSIKLPKVYVDYVTENNTRNGHLYELDQIVEVNLTDEAPTYAPGYVIIASDWGDVRYLMKSGEEETTVYQSDVGDMNPKNFTVFSDDFYHFLELLETV